MQPRRMALSVDGFQELARYYDKLYNNEDKVETKVYHIGKPRNIETP